jgi:amino acid transporter/nucleotide-binding universal stress UspA family protein
MAEEEPAPPPAEPAAAGAAPAGPPGMEPEAAATEGEVKLAREITFLDATMMGVGAMMGGGVFVLLGLASGVSGNGVLLALFLNGFITIPTLLVYAELGSASDDAGGGYLWVKQGLGQPFGFLGGWFSWFSHVIACSLYSIASAAFILTILQYVQPGWLPEGLHSFQPFPQAAPWLHLGILQATALTLAGLFIFLNYLGVKVGIKTENVINSVVLVAVAGFIAAGLYSVWQDPATVQRNLTPFWMPQGTLENLSSVFLSMGITFIAFEGYEIISQTSEEIQNPRRNIPRAIWACFLIAWAIVLLVAFIALGATKVPEGFIGVACSSDQAWCYMSGLKERALIEVASQFLPYGTLIIAGSALLLQLTALNATIYSSSRVSFAMGRDGNLPRFFGRVHAKRRTPHYAVLASGVLVLAMALLPIESVATSADVMFLLLFLLVNMSYIKLRKTIPQERFGFKAPFFPYIPILGITGKFFLAVYLWKYSRLAWYITALWLVAGLLAYYLYIRKRERTMVRPPPVVSMPVARGPRREFRVLVLLSSPAPSTGRALARAAGAIAKSLDGEVVLLQPVLVPEVTPLSEGAAFYKDRTLLQEARAAVPPGVPVHPTVRIGHNLDAMVRETVREEGIRLLVMSGQARATVGQPTSPLLVYPPCDVAVLRLKTPEVKAAHVLVTTEHFAPLGIRLGTAMAHAFGGATTFYHVSGPRESMEERTEWGRGLLDRHAVPGSRTTLQLEEGSAVPQVLERSRGEDLVVVGASMSPRPWRKNILGPRTQEIADRVAGNVLIVRGASVRPGSSNWLGRRLLAIRRYFQPE